MNNPTWDLSIFYKGFDDPALRADIDSIKPLLAKPGEIIESDLPVVAKLEALVDYENDLSNTLGNIMSFVHLTISADNSHAEALRIQDELGMQMVDVKLASSRIARYLSTIENLDEVIASSEKLSAVAFALKEDAENAQHMVPAHMEKELLRMSLNGADAWSKLKDT